LVRIGNDRYRAPKDGDHSQHSHDDAVSVATSSNRIRSAGIFRYDSQNTLETPPEIGNPTDMRRLIQIPMLLLAMLLVGAFGLRVLTGQPALDCFFQAVMLLTTVGALDPSDLTAGAKVFIVLYLAGGIGVFTYSLFQFGHILVSGELRRFLERRRMKKTTDQLSDHFIICGYGRMGATLCEYLHRRGQSSSSSTLTRI
jgi:hypothetical protein